MSSNTNLAPALVRRLARPACAPAAAVGALFVLAYWPLLEFLWQSWWGNEYFQHGLLVPPLAGLLLWRRRAALAAAAYRPTGSGLVLVVGALLVYLGCRWLEGLYTLQGACLLASLAGMAGYLHGGALLRAAALPLAFLGFAIPWPWSLLEAVTAPLQMLATKLTVVAAGLAGFAVRQDGVNLHTPTFSLTVAVPCSGLHTALALLALGVCYAGMAAGPAPARWAVAALALPVAVLANVLRVLVVLAVGVLVGPGAALGCYHTISGFVLFLLAWGMLAGVGRGLGCRLGG